MGLIKTLRKRDRRIQELKNQERNRYYQVRDTVDGMINVQRLKIKARRAALGLDLLAGLLVAATVLAAALVAMGWR